MRLSGYKRQHKSNNQRKGRLVIKPHSSMLGIRIPCNLRLGQMRAPSLRWSSKSAWNLFRNSSTSSMPESTSSGSWAYSIFHSTFSNIFRRKSAFLSTGFSTTFSASIRSRNPSPFPLYSTVTCCALAASSFST
ncbi:hypothetical protein AAHE18_17G221100 [Arachis hypogaea]